MTFHATSRSRNIFPLLSLPAELRLQIYECAFIVPFEIEASFRSNLPQRLCIPGALLRTCRQVYDEAHDYLYKLNTFHVGDHPDDANYAISWLNKISKRNQRLIRRVSIDIYKCKSESRALPFLVFMFELRSAATNLEELSLWLGPKVLPRYLTSHRFLVRELERFGDLKKLTIGGNYSFWWPEYLQTKFAIAKGSDPGVNVEVIYVDIGSPIWRDREEERTRWGLEISKEAHAIQQARYDEKYENWLQANARDLQRWTQVGSGKWRESCQCVDCARWREAAFRGDMNVIHGYQAELERKSISNCKCHAYLWARGNPTHIESSFSCFESQDIIEATMSTEIEDRTLEQNMTAGVSAWSVDEGNVTHNHPPELDSQDEPEEQPSYDTYIKGIETPHTLMPGISNEPNEPSSLSQHPISQSGRKLRREPRRWYGKLS